MELGGCETHPRVWDGHQGLEKHKDLPHGKAQMHWEEMGIGDTHFMPGGCVPNVQGHAWHGAGGILIWSNIFKQGFFGRVFEAHCILLFLQKPLSG